MSFGSGNSLFEKRVIHPFLKNANLDPSYFSSYRPISKLPFLANILEKVVVKQLTSAFDQHNIHDRFQSGFHKLHSAETALLRVSIKILIQYDAAKCSVLVMLDLTSAFDSVVFLWCSVLGPMLLLLYLLLLGSILSSLT